MAEPLEVEKLVGELEVAIDRLRSLYDQYFMGIEKLEPMVPRKDVERRIQMLRKEQIRNTALRFRFQMILQRYNTYQTHWLRICREIENGTYKRHVVRAQERFGGRRASVAPPPLAAARPLPGALPSNFEAELAELDRDFAPAGAPGDFDVDVELEPEPPPRRPPVAAPPAQSAGPPAPVWRKVPTAPQREPAAPAQPSAAPPRPAAPPPWPAAPSTGPAAPPPGSIVPPPRPVTPGTRPPVPPPLVSTRPAPSAPAHPRVSAQPSVPAGPPPQKSAAPAPAPRAPASPGDMSDERVRELYARYVDAKRRQNESTAAITYEAVAKSLRESSAKLREKHGKAVDFEVAVKDGKAILKPVIK